MSPHGLFDPQVDRLLPLCLENLVPLPVLANDTTGCRSRVSECRNQFYFQFESLNNIAQGIYSACRNDTRLDIRAASVGIAKLTHDACTTIAGGRGATRYPAGQIWERLTTWKFPLLQLISQYPRPPLGRRIEALALARLLGNPIGTFRDLVIKVASCRGRALYWKWQFSRQGPLGSFVKHGGKDSAGLRANQVELMEAYGDYERIWKAFALLIDSCDEWGRTDGTVLRDSLHDFMQRTTEGSGQQVLRLRQEQLLRLCLATADELAADRATKFLPVTVAMAFFIGSVGIAFGRTIAAGPHSTTTFITVEAYSIAFTAAYFWIITTVIIAAIIGASQTQNSMVRILQRFTQELNESFISEGTLPRGWPERHDHAGVKQKEERWVRGGVYSWRPRRQQGRPVEETTNAINLEIFHNTLIRQNGTLGEDRVWNFVFNVAKTAFAIVPGSILLPVVNVLLGPIFGILIADRVPPVGWSCRETGIISIFGAWLFNWATDFLIPLCGAQSPKMLLYCHWTKDSIWTILTFVFVILTQVGLFNRCYCYTQNGTASLALPEIDSVAETLSTRIVTTYPLLAFLCIGVQLIVIPGLIIYQYFPAVQVFLQRDDAQSNFSWAQRYRARSYANCGDWRPPYDDSALDVRHWTLRAQHCCLGLPKSTTPMLGSTPTFERTIVPLDSIGQKKQMSPSVKQVFVEDDSGEQPSLNQQPADALQDRSANSTLETSRGPEKPIKSDSVESHRDWTVRDVVTAQSSTSSDVEPNSLKLSRSGVKEGR